MSEEIAESTEAKWYVLHTYSGYENIVKDSMEKIIENNHLEDRILQIQIPMEQDIEEKNGKKKIIMRKIFPCYVFVKIVYNNDLWYLITNVRGVTGFVGPMGKPLPLSDGEVQKMQLETKVDLDVVNFGVGDMVNVVAGPLVGNCGMIEELNIDTQKAKVSVSMFGRETSVELDFVQIQKVTG